MGQKFVANNVIKKPVIGITLDWQKEGTFASRPHYALRMQYFDAIEKVGGIPIGLPYNEDVREDYLNMVDGILIPGGDMAKPLEWYEAGTKELPHPVMPRCDSDIWYVEQCMARKIPFLGLCEGMQVFGGVLGCTLTANVQKSYGTELNHRNTKQGLERVHDVHITERTLLASIMKTDTIRTNSRHTEGIREVSENMIVSGRAEDGVIEAVEAHPELGHPFALGLEWHPEDFTQDGSPDLEVFRAFVRACQG